MNFSGSRTAKASPLGSQETTAASSFLSISISLRGNGFECPVELPGEDEADNAGDTDAALVILLEEDGLSGLEPLVTGEDFGPPGDGDIPGCTLITPAAIPPLTGTTTA